MGTRSNIEWTELTWNPVTGCTKISQGCKNCYAERMAKRLHAMGSDRYRNKFAVTLHPDLVDAPRRWRMPRLVFVNSMSDLFHPEIPAEFIARVFSTMADCPQHTFQVLTKRSDRLAELARDLPWPRNVWMGVSVEDQRVTGPRARTMEATWALSILGQCRAAGVPFFFKQWGGPRKDMTGRKLNGRTYSEMPQRAAA